MNCMTCLNDAPPGFMQCRECRDKPKGDPVNHPRHYTNHPCGLEVIEITKHETFCIGCAIKYLMRYKLKDNPAQDLRKAVWYINKEIESFENEEA